MSTPRILLAAGASGSGKTLITCGLLQALVNRKLKVASFKCGPDYIDPMFHSRVIGTKSRNLDTFFTGDTVTQYLLEENSRGMDISVIEGVMGYYDGVAGTTTQASAYDLARITGTPTILIVNSRGMSISLAAYIQGFLNYRKDSQIRGVILNQMSPMLYPRMKKLIEEELNIRVLGYVPRVEDCLIESRHLGLVLPDEIPELQARLKKLASILETTLDIEGILNLAKEAQNSGQSCFGETTILQEKLHEINPYFAFKLPAPVRIGIADDEAFCFFYEDNFRLLKQMGAELIPISPIHDAHLPDDLDGILLYGGYPELNGQALEDNKTFREELKQDLRNGLPCLAECGGFMYLHEQIEDMEGNFHQGVGILPGKAYRTQKLQRFGYITLHQNQEIFGEADLGSIPAHEFHYFDSENSGSSFTACKPQSSRVWECMHVTPTMSVGFPHFHYYGNPAYPAAFLKKCLAWRSKRDSQQDEIL